MKKVCLSIGTFFSVFIPIFGTDPTIALAQTPKINIASFRIKAGKFDGTSFPFSVSWKAKVSQSKTAAKPAVDSDEEDADFEDSEPEVSVYFVERQSPKNPVTGIDSSGLEGNLNANLKPKTRYQILFFDQADGFQGDGKVIKTVNIASKRAPKGVTPKPIPQPTATVQPPFTPVPNPNSNTNTGNTNTGVIVGGLPANRTDLGIWGSRFRAEFPTELEASGRLVGPSIGLPPATACDRALLAREQDGRSRNSDEPSVEFSCGYIAKNVVTQLAYQGSDNKCYFASLRGTFEITCLNNLPKFNATNNLPFSLIPGVNEPSFNWAAAGAQCHYTIGDQGGGYGSTRQSICGAAPHGTSLPPTPDTFCLRYPTDATCKNVGNQSSNTVPAVGGLPSIGLNYNYPSEIEGRGNLVGPPIGLPQPTGCDRSLLFSENPDPRPTDVPNLEFSCNNIARNVVTQVAYQGSNNKCYFASLNGTFEIACMPGLPRINATTSLPYNLVPGVNDGTFNWYAAGAQCFYTLGDRMGGYGVYRQTICGAAPHGTSLPPTPFNFCQTYPNDSSCIDLVAAYGKPSAGSSGTQFGKACTSNSQCAPSLCFGITASNRTGYCGLN